MEPIEYFGWDGHHAGCRMKRPLSFLKGHKLDIMEIIRRSSNKQAS